MTTTDKLCKELHDRRKMGLRKYGVSLDDNKLTMRQFLQHAKEEALDNAEYLQRLIDGIDANEWPDEDRINVIGQNGNDGLHY